MAERVPLTIIFRFTKLFMLMKKLVKENAADVKARIKKNTRMAMTYIIAVFISLLLFFASCNTGTKDNAAQDATEETEEGNDHKATAKATMEATSGSKVTGEANFSQDGNNVRFELTVQNLTPGEHAVHLHEKGDCSAEDASSAGGHWNPTMKPHGKRDGGGSFHKGDIGNMNVGSDGKGTMNLSVEGWSIGGADSTNIVGKSVIIHEKADDFTSQPAGNAGARISCGVIKSE
jgi:Cu-Zn family superoxide dismutase